MVWLGQLSYRLAEEEKKRLEQQLAQTGETLFTLEFQREAVENATSAEVLCTMELAVHGMRKAYQHMWVWGKGQREPRHWGGWVGIVF